MAFEAQFKHGDPVMADYTPEADVAAGEVVVVGDVPMISHVPIPAGTLGALAIGGGVYEMIADAEIDAGKTVFFAAASNKISETATTSTHFGFTVSASGANGDKILVYHQPKATTG